MTERPNLVAGDADGNPLEDTDHLVNGRVPGKGSGYWTETADGEIVPAAGQPLSVEEAVIGPDPSEGAAGINPLITDGAHIRLQPGEYVISEPIRINANNVHLEGAGMDSTSIRVADGAEVQPILVGDDGGSYQNVTIEKLEADGNRQGQTDESLHLHGIEVFDVQYFSLNNVWIHDTFPHSDGTNGRANGLYIHDTASEAWVTNCLATDCGYDSFGLTGSQMLIANCTARRQVNRGISGDLGDDNAVTDSLIAVNNHAEMGTLTASAMGVRDAGDNAKIVFSNNHLFMRDGATGRRCISVRDIGHAVVTDNVCDATNGASDGIVAIDCKRLALANNSIRNATERGIHIRGEAATIADQNVSGNVVDTAGIEGIRLLNTTESTISNNVVKNATEEGMRIEGDCSSINVSGGVYKGNGKAGISVNGDDTTVSGVLVKNNGTDTNANTGERAGIQVYDALDCVIEGIRGLDDQSTKTQLYAVYAGGTADYNLYDSINARGNSTGGVSMSGSNSVKGTVIE